jgi:two-component system response regulator AtoC
VAFDCSALAPSLLEAELFGHEKGAFTGANRARRGLFREAHGGTIFLDEIGDIARACRTSCCACCRSARSSRSAAIARRSRSTSAWSRRPTRTCSALVARGIFREDLYWRLNGGADPGAAAARAQGRHPAAGGPHPREAARRGEDRSPETSARYPTQVTAKTRWQRLAAYRWPGNIRELENVLSRAAILCDGETIRSHDLDMLGLDREVGAMPKAEIDRVELPPIDLERLGDGEGLKDLTERAVRAVERAAIAVALRRDPNPAAAARTLGISRASIYTKMKTYNLNVDGSPVE